MDANIYTKMKSFKEYLSEKKLTPAELDKREEIAAALEKKEPSMDMGKKMAIATAAAKRVAESTEINEASFVSNSPSTGASVGVKFELKKNAEKSVGELSSGHPKERFDVYHGGKHIGHVESYSAYKDKKPAGSRIVTSRKNVRHWSATVHGGEHVEHGHWYGATPKDSQYTSMGHGTKSEALQKLANSHKSNPKASVSESLDEREVSADRKTIMTKSEGGYLKPRKAIVKVTNENTKYSMLSFKEYKQIYEQTEADIDSQINEAKRTLGLTEAKVKTSKYSWGTMKTVEHGADFSIPLHPEHHTAIAKLKDEQEHQFKTEDGRHWTARRRGDTVHFQGANNGNKTSVPLHTMTESSPFDWKNTKSEINWDGKKKAEAPKEKKSVGRPSGQYGNYKIDKATRQSKEYKDALSAKVRAAKAEGFKIRDEFKQAMDDAIKKHQLKLAGIEQ